MPKTVKTITVRLPVELHALLERAASENRRSLNAEIVHRCEKFNPLLHHQEVEVPRGMLGPKEFKGPHPRPAGRKKR